MRQVNKDLIEATRLGLTAVVQRLLEAGANVHARDNEALRRASDSGHVEVVKVLQSYLNTKDKRRKNNEYEKETIQTNF